MIALDYAQLLASEQEFDPNTVTPGVEGFILTFLVAVIVVLLALDMVRRVRRIRYRSEIEEKLDAEEAAASKDAPRSAEDERSS